MTTLPTNNWNSPKNVNSGETQEKPLSHRQRSYKKAWARRQAEPSENTGCSREHERREFAEVELGDLDDDEWVNMDRDEDEPEDIQELKEEQFNALISIVTLSCITAQHNAESNH